MTNQIVANFEIATITFGDFEMEVVRLVDGKYGIYMNQMKEQLGIYAGDKTGKKYAKPILDKHSNRVNLIRLGKATAKVVPLDVATLLISEYAQLGNFRCQAICFACVTEAFERRCDKEFGIETSEQERDKRLRNRILDQKRKKIHPLFGDENMNKVAGFLKVGRSHPKLANWMWLYIYCTFSQEEICKLNLNNPVQSNGHRKDCIYEWLEENATDKHKQHFDKVLTLVQISTSEREFTSMFNRMFSEIYQQEFF